MRRQKVVVIEFLPRLFLQIWTRAILFFHPGHLSTLLYSAEIKSSAHLMLCTENICVEKNSKSLVISHPHNLLSNCNKNITKQGLLNAKLSVKPKTLKIIRAVQNVEGLLKERLWKTLRTEFRTTRPSHIPVLGDCPLSRGGKNEEAVNECEEE